MAENKSAIRMESHTTLGLIIGMIFCCALSIVILAGLGTAFLGALGRWDLWFGLIAIVLVISTIYIIIRRVTIGE